MSYYLDKKSNKNAKKSPKKCFILRGPPDVKFNFKRAFVIEYFSKTFLKTPYIKKRTPISIRKSTTFPQIAKYP
jgi:hypothetical protein